MAQLNEQIKSERLKQGLTQAELAELISVSENTIYRYERGLRMPRMNIIKRLKIALKTDFIL